MTAQTPADRPTSTRAAGITPAQPRLRTLALGLLAGLTLSGCGSNDTGGQTGDKSPSAAQTTTDRAPPATVEKDACAALPRATIQQVLGADPGEGELEHAARSTLCRYNGKGQVTVEIDPVAALDSARTSIEAYGDHCQAIDDMGDPALFCTGGFKAMGFTGQVVWTDAGHTFYVVYNFGDATPTRDLPLRLAHQLRL